MAIPQSITKNLTHNHQSESQPDSTLVIRLILHLNFKSFI